MNRIYLCAQHKGGVGKTTLAVHATGVLQAGYPRTLLIDCDSQGDAFTFFSRAKPRHPLDLRTIGSVVVVWNPNIDPLRRITSVEEYDRIVIDVESPTADTVKVITDYDPHVLLVPADDQLIGIDHISDILGIAKNLEGRLAYPLEVRIVPLGITASVVNKTIQQSDHKPQNLVVTRRMRSMRKEMNKSLKKGKFIWDYLNEKRLFDFFLEVVQ